MADVDRAEAIRTVMGFDQQLHAELGHGAWDGSEARAALHALGVTDDEIETATADWSRPVEHRHVAGEVSSSSCPACVALARVALAHGDR